MKYQLEEANFKIKIAKLNLVNQKLLSYLRWQSEMKVEGIMLKFI